MYFQYFGNKRLDLKHFKHLFPAFNSDTVFVEPFCGSCSVSVYVKEHCPDVTHFHLNDNDTALITFYKEVKDKGTKYFYDEINKLPRTSKEEFITAIDNMPNQIVQWFANKKFRYRGGADKPGKFVQNDIFKSIRPFKPTHPAAEEMIQLSLLTADDYTALFDHYKNDEKAFLFLDPPYLDSFNSIYNDYKVDKGETIRDSTKVFIDCLKLLQEARCKVMLVINENAITRHLYGPYIKAVYLKTYQMTKRKTGHIVVCNYDI